MIGCSSEHNNPTLSNRHEADIPGLDKRSRQNSVDQVVVANRLIDAGEPGLAYDAYIRAAEEQGLTLEIEHGLAVANLALGRVGQAQKGIEKILKDHPEDARAWNNLGVALLSQEEFGEAKLSFERAFAFDGGQTPKIRENLINTLALLDKNEYSEKNNANYVLLSNGGGLYSLTSTAAEP